MDDCPFHLQVERRSPPGVELLTCSTLLRAVPGTRYVYDARWKDRPVIVKVFCRRFSARRHQWREWRGLKRLEALGLDAPKPLFRGRAADGWVVVTEKIIGASTALVLLRANGDAASRRGLLIRLCRELARDHECGVVQTDLHLGNFLVRDETVYLLDPAQMRFARRPLRRAASLRQLARLLCWLCDDVSPRLDELASAYAAERQWHWGPLDAHRLRRQMAAARRISGKRVLKKCLRTSSRTVRVVSAEYRGVFDRRLTEGAPMAARLRELDDRMQEGRILKNGNTCLVSRLLWNGQDVVVKRYNHKGLLHSLRHTLKGSRARRNWLNAHYLGLLTIATPEPLGYVDRHRGPLLWQSYFITRFVSGPQVNEVLRDEAVLASEKQRIHETVLALLRRMAEYGVSHGDMKHTNLLYDGTRVVLMDLDAMRIGGPVWLCRRRGRRDLDRYLRDLPDTRMPFEPLQGREPGRSGIAEFEGSDAGR